MPISEALNVSVTGFVVVLIVLAVLACIIVVLSKAIRTANGEKKDVQVEIKSNPASTPVQTVDSTPVVTAPEAVEETISDSKIIKFASEQMVTVPGCLTLYKTSEKEAATIMAIVSHESGIPLNRLAFSSIKLDDSLELYKTDDKTAATIMAIISHQTEIPLDRLVFKSIKLIEE